MTLHEIIGGNVKRLRLEAGLTQAELCARMKLDEPALVAYERGRRKISAATAWRLARALGVSIGGMFVGCKKAEDA